MAGDILGVTNLSALTLASTLSVGGVAKFTSAISLSGGADLGGSKLTMGGGVLSIGTISFSILTGSQMSLIPDGHLGLLHQASGFSLVYRSGSTIYTVGASAVSSARV